MGNITVLGIDISKNVFELCGLDSDKSICYRKRVSRKKFMESVVKLHPDLILMEACGGEGGNSKRFKIDISSTK